MGCRLAENAPLNALRAELGIEPSCHSFREDCVHNLLQPTRQNALAATGAVIGYCQALFGRAGTPAENTLRVAHLLSSIGAPWSHSHELYWGHRGSDTAGAFLASAFEPFRGVGRVPIVITELRAARNAGEIAEITAVSPPVEENEPVLVRIILEDRADIDAATAMIDRLLKQCRQTRAMPRWWPLLQGDLTAPMWREFQKSLGKSWRYVNIAVNPFVSAEARALIDEQVTVCQIPVGVADEVHANGFIGLPDDMALTGRTSERGYNIFGYLRTFNTFEVAPTLLVLGPTKAHWSDEFNKARISEILPLIRTACDGLWEGIPAKNRDLVWSMPA